MDVNLPTVVKAPADPVDKALDAALEMTFPASDPVAVFVAGEEDPVRNRAGAVLAAALVVAACHEIPQDAAKSFAGPAETKPYMAPRFNGDRSDYEETLAKRAGMQNEYLRIREVNE